MFLPFKRSTTLSLSSVLSYLILTPSSSSSLSSSSPPPPSYSYSSVALQPNLSFGLFNPHVHPLPTFSSSFQQFDILLAFLPAVSNHLILVFSAGLFHSMYPFSAFLGTFHP
jgi:hypothetical protein